MPPKTVKCGICGEEVTKRSTLQFEAKDGTIRACRTHPEVKECLEEQLKQKTEQLLMEKIDQELQIMSGVSFVRCMCTIHDVSEESLYHRFRLAKMPEKIIDKIRQGVKDRGGPIMSSEEFATSLAIGLQLRKEGKL